jgi:Kef-type K+ transport system membrane component KefB
LVSLTRTPVVSRRYPGIQSRSHALPGIIIITTQILSLGLRKLRQPRVIAEVLGGILLGMSSAPSCSRCQLICYLGPTAFGRIPGFSKHIFPTQSIPYLSLVANIGLCLFLFLVGLEIDTAIIRRNLRLSATIAAAGITIPFGFGAALAIPIYHQFIDSSQVSYPHFMLFTGVAYSITAFPVLCRILTELKLLDTTVGIVVLSAGVGNDIIGWTLLALSVALVNAGSGLTALWILLACIGWSIFMLFIVRRVLFWIARSTRSIENGPTILFMTFTILVLFGSAFFTDVIGVHAVFGIVSHIVGRWCVHAYELDVMYRCIPCRDHRSTRWWPRYFPDREARRYGLCNIPAIGEPLSF